MNLHTNTWNIIHGRDSYGAFLFDVPEVQYRAANTEATPPPDVTLPAASRLRQVLPRHHGLLFFAGATANRSRLLPATPETSANVKAWATLDSAATSVRVAIINKDTTASDAARVTVPGYRRGTGRRLQASSFRTHVARSGHTWGGQTFDGSTNGRPVGEERRETIPPSADGAFTVTVAPVSAVLLTLTG